MPQDGIHIGHGARAPWTDGRKLHKRFGRLPWSDLFQPAIYYARNGFPVTEIIHDALAGLLRQP